jgi:hypothetical protein
MLNTSTCSYSRALGENRNNANLKSWLHGGNDDLAKARCELHCLGPPFLAPTCSFLPSLAASGYHPVEGAPQSLPPLLSTFAFYEFIHDSSFRTFLCRRGLTPQHHFQTSNRSKDIAGKWLSGISSRYATKHQYRYVRWWERSRQLRVRMGLRQSAIRAASKWPTRSSSKALHRSCTSQH